MSVPLRGQSRQYNADALLTAERAAAVQPIFTTETLPVSGAQERR